MRRLLDHLPTRTFSRLLVLLALLALVACSTVAGFSEERSGDSFDQADSLHAPPSTVAPNATQKISFIQDQTHILSGSPFYEPLVDLSIKTASSGHLLVQATGTITTDGSGIYVDVGVSTNQDSVEWAYRAGFPEVDTEGPLSWPFQVSHVYEVKSLEEKRFFLNARQLGEGGAASVEIGSMYALWIEGVGSAGTR